MLLAPLRNGSPAAWLATGLVTAAAIVAFALSLAIHQPWLGLQLAAPTDGTSGLIVRSTTGPAQDIAPETRLITAGSLSLDDGDITPEPDTRYAVLAAYRDFLRKQQALFEQLHRNVVVLVDAEGTEHTIRPAPQRPWRDLPGDFWLQLFVAVGGFLLGLSVWAFRRTDPAATYFALTGLGLMLSAASAAVYSSRELTLPATTFRLLHAVNGAGSMLFCAAFLATLWHYPTRLARRDPGPSLVLLYLALSAATTLQWLPDFDVALRLPILLGFSATIVLAFVQWRRTHQRPLERAALKWFLLAWFSGSTLFLALVFVPALFGVDTGALQAYAFALFLLIYIGVAFGIVRYQLFQLDRWWLNAWSFLLLLAVLMAIGVALFFGLDVDPLLATALSIASAGWLYLPLRHWLSGRLASPPLEALLPQILQEVVAAGATTPQALWPETLRRLFRPLDLQPDEPAPTTQIVGNGLVLRVPDLHQGASLRLTGCEGGARLFADRDRATADAMRTVIERLLDYGRAVDIGAERERLRVSRDLHDDIGARLLELLHRSSGPTQDRVRAILDELRLVIASLGSRGDTLDNLLGICRAETNERLEGTDIELRWSQADPLQEWRLDPHQALLIVRCLREGAANALAHARPRTLEVTTDCTTTAFTLTLVNDGVDSTVGTSEGGRSLAILRSRAAALGGELQGSPRDASHWELRLSLPQRMPA